ncbi:MAG TPA: hypothetical protein VGD65_01615 [Chryseosolibacter sp.]
MRYLVLVLLCVLLVACERSYLAKENLSTGDYETTLAKIAPYVIGKSDEFSFEERFLAVNKPFYNNFIQLANGELTYFLKLDTASLFFFRYRDLTSLYEHYRGIGGYFRVDQNGSIVFMNLLYHTPRLTKSEMDERGKILFEEMMRTGSVKSYLGNKLFVHTPNRDFYYNTKLNRWDYTENSSWKFLEQARQQAESDSAR